MSAALALSIACSKEPNSARKVADSFVSDYASGKYANMLSSYELDEGLRENLSESLLEQVWNNAILAYCGPYVGIDLKNAIYDIASSTFTYSLSFSYQKAFLMVGVDESGTVFEFVLLGFENTHEIEFSSSLKAVSVSYGDEEFPVQATLVYKESSEKLPCAIIVADSGALALGRYGLTGPNAVYFDIAQALAQEGIAVILYELRQYTYGAALGSYIDAETEYLLDIMNSVIFAEKQSVCDPEKIFIVGHGTGAYMSALLAHSVEGFSVAGHVFLCLNNSPIEDMFYAQLHAIASLDGQITSDEEETLEMAREIVDRIKSLTPQTAQLHSAESLLGRTASYWLSLQGFSPAAALKSFEAPMLLCYAEYDYITPLSEMLAFEEELSGKQGVQILMLPNTNHHFMPAQSLLGVESYYQPADLDQRLITAIVGFINGM
ncbi:MAG: alpha/beta fold hydrolase [Eubacteriaceae bacterium]|nr:alpha/beta fold hydrolase [Eubacteriaceae bacterium]